MREEEERMGWVLMSEDGRGEGCEEVKEECGVRRAHIIDPVFCHLYGNNKQLNA